MRRQRAPEEGADVVRVTANLAAAIDTNNDNHAQRAHQNIMQVGAGTISLYCAIHTSI
jgi:hypothetical protein